MSSYETVKKKHSHRHFWLSTLYCMALSSQQQHAAWYLNNFSLKILQSSSFSLKPSEFTFPEQNLGEVLFNHHYVAFALINLSFWLSCCHKIYVQSVTRNLSEDARDFPNFILWRHFLCHTWSKLELPRTKQYVLMSFWKLIHTNGNTDSSRETLILVLWDKRTIKFALHCFHEHTWTCCLCSCDYVMNKPRQVVWQLQYICDLFSFLKYYPFVPQPLFIVDGICC